MSKKACGELKNQWELLRKEATWKWWFDSGHWLLPFLCLAAAGVWIKAQELCHFLLTYSWVGEAFELLMLILTQRAFSRKKFYLISLSQQLGFSNKNTSEKLDVFLFEKLENFDTDVSCSFFIKYMCPVVALIIELFNLVKGNSNERTLSF